MALKLLAVGDLHLGRRPGGLPEDLRDAKSARALGPAAALERLVDAAIAEPVDAVVLAGDLVEDEHDFFEAYGDLFRAVERLVNAGIRVLGVAGNHDVQVLPRLADELSGFHLLGRGGEWEATEIVGADDTGAVLHGWSFPRARVTTSPLTGQRFERDHRPHLGLLHCDRDQHGSHHAPVTTRELEAAGLDAWLLGHIHKPDPLTRERPSGYLGSVTALRRTETGPRGPWLYRIAATGIEAVEQWRLAPLRWEELEVDLTGLGEAAEAPTRVVRAIRERAEAIATSGPVPDVLGFSLQCSGRTSLAEEAGKVMEQEQTDDIPAAGMRCFAGRIRFDTLPEMDLGTLAEEKSPAGILARKLLILDEPGHVEHRDLVERARRHLADHVTDLAWQPLDRGEPDDTEVIAWLRRALAVSLDALQAQRNREAE